MLDGIAAYKPHVTVEWRKMTRARGIWLGLALLASACAAMLGVPLWLSGSALICAILPPLVGMFVQGSATNAQVNELEAVLWIAVATMGATSTGGLSSPILVLFAVPVVTAWSSGRARLTAEVAAFSLLGLAAAGVLGADGSWLDQRDADILGTLFGVAGLVLVGAVAALEVSRGSARFALTPVTE